MAAQNLKDLPVRVIQEDAVIFLSQTSDKFDLIVVDIHGNSESDWRRYADPLLSRLNPAGTLLLDNAILYKIPEWNEETGIRWFLEQLPPDWKVELITHALPGVAAVTKPMTKIQFCDHIGTQSPVQCD